jgi:Kef-type K+ transport system membrane component KefB
VGFVFYKFYKKWIESADRGRHRHAIIAFVFCLLMSYVAEAWFGVADITGAYIAGLIISNTERSEFIQSRFDTLSFLLLPHWYLLQWTWQNMAILLLRN